MDTQTLAQVMGDPPGVDYTTLQRIPEQITQGRQVGVEEEVMIQAVTHVPEPETAPE